MKDVPSLPLPENKKLIGLVMAAIAATTAIAYYGISQSGLLTPSSPEPVLTTPPAKKVTALGRLRNNQLGGSRSFGWRSPRSIISYRRRHC